MRGIVGFNPRTREGCDAEAATLAPRKTGFNPRTREGCDVVAAVYTMTDLLFQSTHPRGVRLVDRILADPDFGFNPRTREGCDAATFLVS